MPRELSISGSCGRLVLDVSTEGTAPSMATVLFLRYFCAAETLYRTYLTGLILEPIADGTQRRIGLFMIVGTLRVLGEIMSFLEYPELKVFTVV